MTDPSQDVVRCQFTLRGLAIWMSYLGGSLALTLNPLRASPGLSPIQYVMVFAGVSFLLGLAAWTYGFALQGTRQAGNSALIGLLLIAVCLMLFSFFPVAILSIAWLRLM